MKILFTGASSFTGFWFVKKLAAAGHELVCPITGDLAAYTGTRQQRVRLLKPLCRFVPRAPFGSEDFLRLAGGESFDLLCHHGADVTNYKSPDFDAAAALRNNTHNLPRVLAALRSNGLKAVVLTGTYFEPDEGAGDEPLRAFSPYSQSKALTFQAFQRHCRKAAMTLGKFVLPNPFGPLEEPRFTGHLMQSWRDGKVAGVTTPDYVRDNIHVDLLALAYAKFAGDAAADKTGSLKLNPAGYRESQGEFAQRVAREVSARTGWACDVRLSKQEVFSEPRFRVNTEPAARLAPGWSEKKAWDRFVKFYNPVG